MISRAEAERIEDRDIARRARERSTADKASEFTGFVGGAIVLGAAGSAGKGWIPAKIMNIDTDLVLGVLAYMYARRGKSKNHSMARGFSYSALAGGIRDIGASLATRF